MIMLSGEDEEEEEEEPHRCKEGDNKNGNYNKKRVQKRSARSHPPQDPIAHRPGTVMVSLAAFKSILSGARYAGMYDVIYGKHF